MTDLPVPKEKSVCFFWRFEILPYFDNQPTIIISKDVIFSKNRKVFSENGQKISNLVSVASRRITLSQRPTTDSYIGHLFVYL